MSGGKILAQLQEADPSPELDPITDPARQKWERWTVSTASTCLETWACQHPERGCGDS